MKEVQKQLGQFFDIFPALFFLDIKDLRIVFFYKPGLILLYWIDYSVFIDELFMLLQLPVSFILLIALLDGLWIHLLSLDGEE